MWVQLLICRICFIMLINLTSPLVGGMSVQSNVWQECSPMPSGLTNLTNQPIGGWGAPALGGWNVWEVTHKSHMFENCRQFNQPLSSWNVSAAKDMSQMFYHATIFSKNNAGDGTLLLLDSSSSNIDKHCFSMATYMLHMSTNNKYFTSIFKFFIHLKLYLADYLSENNA